MPVANLLPLISKFNLSICSLSTHLSPLNIFALPDGMTLNFFCRRCWRDFRGKKKKKVLLLGSGVLARKLLQCWWCLQLLVPAVHVAFPSIWVLQYTWLSPAPRPCTAASSILRNQQLHLLRQFYVERLQEDSSPSTDFLGTQRAHFQQAPKGRKPASSGGTMATPLLSVTYDSYPVWSASWPWVLCLSRRGSGCLYAGCLSILQSSFYFLLANPLLP